jgi:hypothetical protein
MGRLHFENCVVKEDGTQAIISCAAKRVVETCSTGRLVGASVGKDILSSSLAQPRSTDELYASLFDGKQAK